MESVEANMDFPAEFQLDLWRFDWLTERSLGNIALRRADRSAIVLISVGRSNPLPVAAENWINTWVQIEQSQPLALVVLLPKENQAESHPLHELLRAAARRKGVDFFCEFFDQSAGYRNVSPAASRTSEEIVATARTFEFGANGEKAGLDENPQADRNQRTASPVVSLSAEEAAFAFGEAKESDVLTKVTLSDISPKSRRQSGLPNDCEGVLVAGIDASSPAFKAGLRAGDVIQQMDRQDVRVASEAVSLSHRAKGKNVLLRVWSQGDSRFLVVNRNTPTARAEKPLCS